MKKFFVALLLVAIFVSCNNSTVYLSDFLTEESSLNAMPAVHEALKVCAAKNAEKLVLPGDTLNLLSGGFEVDMPRNYGNSQSNIDVAFNLTGIKNLKIEGNGTTLLFSGFVVPFLMLDSEDITISDLNIDYVHTIHSEADIVGVGEDWIDLKFKKEYICKIENGLLQIYDKRGINYPYGLLLEYDPAKQEPAIGADDQWTDGPGLPAEEIGDNTFRIHKAIKGTPGNVLVLGAGVRRAAAFPMTNSKNITIKNVNLYHCGGMGVTADCCRNIYVENFVVEPSAGRVMSIPGDPTHFSNCTGEIRVLNCRFRGQYDDDVNIHGMYMTIREILDEHTFIAEWPHHYVQGDFLKENIHIEIENGQNMQSMGRFLIETVSPTDVDNYSSIVRLKESIPAEIQPGMVVAADEEYPDVLVEGCRFGGHRARGIIMNNRGHTVIRNNWFHTDHAAINFEGDASYWYEQSGARDVEISGNTFENCNFGHPGWNSDACITIGTRIPDLSGPECYHRNIRITGNTFKIHCPCILNLYCVDGLVFKDNVIIETNNEYPNRGSYPERFRVSPECKNIEITE